MSLRYYTPLLIKNVKRFCVFLLLFFAGINSTKAQFGIINTLAGTGTASFTGDGGLATAATVNTPVGVWVVPSGDVYFADQSNNRIRKITVATGIITTIAGTGTAGFSGDGGAATSAELNKPAGIFIDPAGNIYIGDLMNNRVRKVTPGGIISTVAGNGTAGFAGDGGLATSAELNEPWGVWVEPSGNILITDQLNYRVRKVDITTGNISTIAGNGGTSFCCDGGLATSASFSTPSGIVETSNGTIIFSTESGDARVREILPTGIIQTAVGTGTAGYSGDCGPATSAEIEHPRGLALDTGNNLYLATLSDKRIRLIDSLTGNIHTVAGSGSGTESGDGGPALNAGMNPICVFVDVPGNIYITGDNRVRKVTVALTNDTLTLCAGPVTLGSAVSYADSTRWSTGATTSSIVTNTPGVYWVKMYVCTYVSIDTYVVESCLTPANNGPLCPSDTLKLLAIGDSTGATYLWYGPAGFTSTLQDPVLPNVTYADSGVYHVVKTSGGINDTVSTDVIIKTQPVVTAGSNSPLCSSGTLSLTATPDFIGETFNWTGPNGFTSILQNPTIVSVPVMDTGTYRVVTSLNGCVDSGTIYVIVDSTPVTPVAGSNTPVCSGNTLLLNATDATSGVSYNWVGPNSFTSTLQNPSITAASTAASGTYTVTVSLAICSATTTATVTVNPTPPLPLFTPVIPVCSGKPIDLLASDTLGAVPPATYSWTGPNGFTSTQQNPVINPSTMASSGIYSLVATLNGCPSAMGTEAVLVDSTPANVTATSNSPICQGTDLDFFASSSTTGASVAYNWTNATGGFTSTLQNPVIPAATTAASGFYSVSVTYNGICGAGATVLVTVNPIPVLASDSVTSPVCSGQTLGLYSTFSPTGGTYNWTGPLGFTSTMQNPSIPGVPTTAAGVYSVSETLNGCTSDTATMTVIVNSTPAVPSIGSNTPVCQGDTLLLTSADDTAGISYSWAGPNSFASSLQDPFIANATPAAAGTYTVYAILGSCVSSSATIVSITQTPTLTPTSNSPVCSGDTLLLYANAPATATVSWTGPYDFTSLAPSPIRTNAVTEYSGIYEVTEFLNNCYGHAYDTVVVNQTPLPPWVTWLTYCQYYPAPPLMTVDGVGVLWYPADSVQSGGSPTPPVPPTTAVGSTFYYATQTVNGCTSAIDSIQVTVNPIPTVTVSPDMSICPHTTLTLTATDTDPIAYYHWSPATYLNDVNTASVIANAETDITYTVVASNQFGCSDTGSVSVTVYPAALISLGDSVTLYPGETYTMNPTTNCTSFSWFPPAGLSSDIISNPVVSPLVSTEYTVVGQTQDGCTTSDSINIYVSANSLISLPNAFTPGSGVNAMFTPNVKGEVSLDYFRIFDRWGLKVFETTNIHAGWDGTFNGVVQPFGVYVYEIEAVTSNGQNFVVHGNVTLLR